MLLIIKIINIAIAQYFINLKAIVIEGPYYKKSSILQNKLKSLLLEREPQQ